MITCKKCGTHLNDDAQFCGECGEKVETAAGYCPKCGHMYSDSDSFCFKCGYDFNDLRNIQRKIIHEPAPSNDAQRKTFLIAGICAGVIVALVFLVIAIYFLAKDEPSANAGSENNSSVQYGELIEEGNGKIEQEPEPEKEIPVEHTKSLDEKIDDFIFQRVPYGDIGVCVVDNITGQSFSSENGDDEFVAWGWYLPVYALYTSNDGYSKSVADGIMSRDAGVCNNNANTVIEMFGGPDAVTEELQYYFDTDDTSYGRYFGDVNANSDNYTTPEEAVLFLKYINARNEYNKLSYNLADFSIGVPYRTAVYAQAGTENRNVRNELNLFAVVKSDYADYCVAIMTKNDAGTYISEILKFINKEMEQLYHE